MHSCAAAETTVGADCAFANAARSARPVVTPARAGNHSAGGRKNPSLHPFSPTALRIESMTNFFEYIRADGSVPPIDRDRVDVAVLDMNASWPNVGHDSIVS